MPSRKKIRRLPSSSAKRPQLRVSPFSPWRKEAVSTTRQCWRAGLAPAPVTAAPIRHTNLRPAFYPIGAQAAFPIRELQFRGKTKAQMFLNHEGVCEMLKHSIRRPRNTSQTAHKQSRLFAAGNRCRSVDPPLVRFPFCFVSSTEFGSKPEPDSGSASGPARRRGGHLWRWPRGGYIGGARPEIFDALRHNRYIRRSSYTCACTSDGNRADRCSFALYVDLSVAISDADRL